MVYRTIAYLGGPLALDSAIDVLPSLGTTSGKDISSWLDNALSEAIKIRAVIAALLPIERHNTIALLKVATHQKRELKRDRTPGVLSEERMAEIVDYVQREMMPFGMPEVTD
jgi:hypothetical protein